MQEHDSAYKNLFSHPQTVRDLLCGFVHEDWVALLDFSTLEKTNSSYVADDLRDRESDIVWRIQRKTPHTHEPGEWLYVYLLLEFQSSIDNHMAVRMMAYVALLYQDLIKSKQLRGGKLPMVFPVVLYNGRGPWGAARAVENLMETGPDSLDIYGPKMSYFLLDTGRLPPEALIEQNLVASILQIERSKGPAEIHAAIKPFAKLLEAPENAELMRAVTVWVKDVVIKRFAPGDAVIQAIQNLQEADQVLAENMEDWAEQQRQVGNQQGMQQMGVRSLKRIIARRFETALPSTFDELIKNADVEQLEIWIDRCLDAPDLNGVFEH
jgi:predicted transposase/invertase (TIGR01784 family)